MKTPLPDAAWIARLLELPPDERPDFVARTCREQLDWRDRLRELLASLEPTATRPHPDADDDRARALALALESGDDSTLIADRYKLLEKVGEGGFGVVWMAEQRAPVRRRVAVKIIKRGMDTREVITRFEAERQALAMMDHPNIARVFDAGETDSGRPFFVMELVRGVPITRYCDDQRLSTEARLQLFITVCQAVQHAHQKGVIHRDLKPSNIIVTLHDGVPVPKIIDFGIAKATEVPLTDRTLFTQFHAFLGTPAYTSPEQMELSGLDVDTRSDIYSLGVLLYELLAGQPPFDPDRLQKSGLEAMRRTIREVDPPRPSQRVSTLTAEQRTTVARQRDTNVARLPLLLRGDLDWIVMHCLEKDRTRRYGTASDLAADVQHHLDDEPVLAQPPGTAYRIRKFIRRHQLGFTTGTVAAAALLTGLAAVSTSLVRERAARARETELRAAADANAERARLAAANSAQVAQFMSDMLGSIGPNVALGRDTALLRDIADATVRRLESDLRDQPRVAADLRDTLGAVYLGLGRPDIAAPLLREAVAAHAALTGAASAETAKSLTLLTRALRLGNKPLEAEEHGQRALAIRKDLWGEDHPAFAETLEQLSFIRLPGRGPDELRTMRERVLAIRRQAYRDEPDHPAIAQALYELGKHHARDALDHVTAAKLHDEALQMRRRFFGNDHPEVARSLYELGYSYAHELDRRAEAVEIYTASLALGRKLLGDEHPNVLIPFLGLAGQLSARTIPAAQFTELAEFVAKQRRVLPHDSARLVPSLLALAALTRGPAGAAAEGMELVREARDLLARAHARGDSLDTETIDAMHFFAWSKFTGNLPDEGLVMAEATLQAANVTYGVGQPGTTLPLHVLGWIHFNLGRHDAAIPCFDAAERLIRTGRGEFHPQRLNVIAALAECHRSTGQLAHAHRILQVTLERYDALPDAAREVVRIGPVLAEFGQTLLAAKSYADAEAVFRRALDDYAQPGIKGLGLRMRPPQPALSGLGLALAGLNRFNEAERYARQAFEEVQTSKLGAYGDHRAMLRQARDAVLTVYAAWGRADLAAAWEASHP